VPPIAALFWMRLGGLSAIWLEGGNYRTAGLPREVSKRIERDAVGTQVKTSTAKEDECCLNSRSACLSGHPGRLL